MSFVSSLFPSSLTPIQYCFPYFFDEKQFKKQIEKLGLSYKLTINEEDGVYNPLVVFNHSNFSFQINYFSYLMFDSFDDMVIWNTEEDMIKMSRISLNNGLIEKVNFNINLADFSIGVNQHGVNYGLSNFVTYVRKKDIRYDLKYFETFAIIIINQNCINIIPFDWFNKTGGDYGYVWPATAQLNLKSFELTGKGMRMADFKIQLPNKL